MLDSPFDMTCVLLNCETYNRNLLEIKFVNDWRNELQSVSKLGSGVYKTFKIDSNSEKTRYHINTKISDLGYETNVTIICFFSPLITKMYLYIAKQKTD